MPHGGKESAKRYRERKAKEFEERLLKLREAGMVCENCSHYERGICSLHSDFLGRVSVKKDFVCVDHKI